MKPGAYRSPAASSRYQHPPVLIAGLAESPIDRFEERFHWHAIERTLGEEEVRVVALAVLLVEERRSEIEGFDPRAESLEQSSLQPEEPGEVVHGRKVMT